MLDKSDSPNEITPKVGAVSKLQGATIGVGKEGSRAAGGKRYDRRLTNTLGGALVVLCLLVPLALNAITYSIEAAEIRAYASVADSEPTVAPPNLAGSPLDDHFYFINGCVGNPIDCDRGHPGSWQEYYTETGKLYNTWSSDRATSVLSFDDWAADHVVFLGAFTADTGMYKLNDALEKDTAARSIHIVGTSAGGASAISYLSKSMRGELHLDPRIRDVMAVDSPLGFQNQLTLGNLWFGFEAGAMRNDLWPVFGRWTQEKKISVLLIDTPNDIVGHDPVPGIAEDAAPVYPDSDTPPLPGSETGCESIFCPFANFVDDIAIRTLWHGYTSTRVSNSARAFMKEHWR